MGTFVSGVCECGYRSGSLMLGAGMANFEEECRAPARCETCEEVVDADIVDPRSGVPPLRGCSHVLRRAGSPRHGDGTIRGVDWVLPDGRLLVLGPGPFHCPRCGERTLRFGMAGLFD